MGKYGRENWLAGADKMGKRDRQSDLERYESMGYGLNDW